MLCPKCGNQVAKPTAKFCNKCGALLNGSSAAPKQVATPKHVTAPQPVTPPAQHSTTATSSAPAGYEATFAKFDAANGGFLWTWNWSAFMGGVLWCFAKRLYRRGLLGFLFVVITCGYGLLALPLIYGVMGNWLYYLAKRDGEDEWFRHKRCSS